jgi:putative heme-binding domain-containing protein
VYLPIPNRYYEAVKGWSNEVLTSIALWNRFYPVTENVRQVDWHGGFTAAAGHVIYTARAYPKHYWNRTSFVAEPTGHLIATFLLEPNGSDFAADNSWNLLASDDEWTAPINAEVGPDGHVWMIDWYNFIVQHNPTPEGFKTGRRGAYETPLRDKTHGRIYRLVYKGAKSSPISSLDPKDGKGLVAALKSDNMFWRMHAQRLIVERGEKDVVPALVALAGDQSTDAIGLNTAAIHALNTLNGLGALGEKDSDAAKVVLSALKHPAAGVRRNALENLPKGRDSVDAILSAKLLNDRDPQVRLAAFLALADQPAAPEAAKAVASALVRGGIAGDRWMGDALTAAAANNADGFLKALAAETFERPPSGAVTTIVARVAEHHAQGGAVEAVGPLLARLGDADGKIADAIVNGLAAGWPKDRPAKIGEADDGAIIALMTKLSAGARGSLVSLGARLGSKKLEQYSGEVRKSLLAMIEDANASESARAEAARQLIELSPFEPEAAETLLALITPRTSPGLAAGLIAAVSRSSSPEVAGVLVKALPALTPSSRADAIRALLGREDWVASYLGAIERGDVRLDELSLDQKQALAGYPNRAIASRAKKLLARGGGLPDADRQKVIGAVAPIALKRGDASKGKSVFAQQCAKCHRHGGEGGMVGPDLTGMAAHPKGELLINILDPSRSVEGNFVSYTVATTDGRMFNGLLASETRTSVELIDTEGKAQKLQRDDIEELVASKKSLMPEGFEKQISPESIADLLEFLTQRGKYMPLDLRKVATIDSTHGMFHSKDAAAERLVFADWSSPKLFEGVPFSLVDPQGGKVPNVVLLYGPRGTFPPRMPRSVTLPCNAPVRAIHMLSGVSGWGYNGGDRKEGGSLIVRLHYAGGSTEDHPLRDGVEFADYIRRVDVPGSKFAFALGNRQVRYLSLRPERPDVLESIELVKGPDGTAPVVMAVTAELPE